MDSGKGLVLEAVNAYYGTHQVTRDISLSIPPGRGVAVVGRNGVGKTTLLRSIMGAFGVRVQGHITLDGSSIRGRPTDEIARRGIALVPSDRRIFPITVRQNLGLAARGATDWEARGQRAIRFFPLLQGRMDQRADTLSGGEQQALAIARATVMQPRYLLLDEPSEGLSPVLAASLVEGIRELQEELGVGILLAERNVRVVAALCDDVHAIVKGRIVMSSSAADFAADVDLQHQLLTPMAGADDVT